MGREVDNNYWGLGRACVATRQGAKDLESAGQSWRAQLLEEGAEVIAMRFGGLGLGEVLACQPLNGRFPGHLAQQNALLFE
jgi:hypothetical protein